MDDTGLTERNIRNLVSEASFQRGEEYFQSGAVSELVRRGDTLSARVEGSEFDPYRVTIHLHDGGIAHAVCDCLYDWGGFCKHIVAVLLSFLRYPDELDHRPPLAELLANLDRDQLMKLLVDRLADDPPFADWVETQIAPGQVSSEGKPAGQRRTMVDSEPIRRQARNLVRSSGRKGSYRNSFDSHGNADELWRLVESAVPFLEAGDGRNALNILRPISETLVEEWLQYYSGYDEEMYPLFDDLGVLMADAVLSADLSGEERGEWASILEKWLDKLDEYGIGEGFHVAISAVAEGWNDPALQRVLRGESNDLPATESSEWLDNRLTASRLRALECAGRFDEYLRLASAAGHRVAYSRMLVALDRFDEAAAYGIGGLETPDEALELAKAFAERGEPGRAIEVAEAGLDLPTGEAADFHRSPVALAGWLRDFATGLGKGELALRAAVTAFRGSLTLDNYRAAQGVAGKQWPETRSQLLDHLAAAEHAYERTGIYLFEGMIDEAVASVDELGLHYRRDTLMELVEAAHRSHPEWVIGQCRKQAEPIMDDGRARQYADAARWLEVARRAYHHMERGEAWSDYLTGLLAKHHRKYKMRPLLAELA